VQLFTALGFWTGFSIEEAMGRVDEISHAGLERSLVDETNPYVIKSPWYADQLPQALPDGKVEIYAALVPVRGLFEAAESRRRVYRELRSRNLNALAHPGTLWHTADPDNQEDVLARQFYKTVLALVQHEVPIYLLEFPRLIAEPDYLFTKLAPLMSDHGVAQSEFLQAHRRTARPELVHDFGAAGT
jgi:hypothetical protein